MLLNLKNSSRYLHLLVIYINVCILLCGGGLVNFKLTDIDSPTSDLLWCGSGKDTLLVLTEKNSLYRSDDKGFSFKKLNDVLVHTGKQELEENENEVGKVSKLIESPVDKSLVIFLGTHGINWIGEDCGRKIKALNHGRKIQEFHFHPTERDWGLASAFTLCEDFVKGEPCRIFKELFVTKDLGGDWAYLGPYVHQFGWGAVDEAHIKAGVPKERIIVTTEQFGKGHQKTQGWSYKVDLYYSDDFFKTVRIGVHKGNRFFLTRDFLYVAQVVDVESGDVNLLLAKSTDKKYNFEHVEVNSHMDENSYSFLDASQDTVFLHINHFGDVSKFGHIYISDSSGGRFSLSLKYNVRSPHDHRCDFQKVESIEGTYIANVIDNNYMEDSEQEMEEEEMAEKESMNVNTEHHNNGQTEPEDAYKNYIGSMITFNKGSTWKRLTAPSKDSTGKKYQCGDACYLNLHGPHGDFAGFYSVQSAAGIVMANGNVGQYLSHVAGEIATFLSRDGGLNWFEIHTGSHIYEIGDHGALIVIADDGAPTDTVYFSWDEGLTWHDVKISSEKIMIKNIVIDPNSISQNFVIYGEANKKGVKMGVVLGLDFSSLHEPQCRNPETPNTDDSDYETWSPNDGRVGHECLLGKKVVYVRRKRQAECYNGLAFERKTEVKFCDCTDEDYECDYGFARSYISDPCTPIAQSTKNQTNMYEPPENCNGHYSISKGYRKVPGDMCVNGVKYDPIILQCPNKLLIGLGKFTLFLIIGFLAIGLIMIFFNKNYFSSIAGVGGLLKSKNRDLRQSEYIDIDCENETLFDEENDPLENAINNSQKDKGIDKKNKKKNKNRDLNLADDNSETLKINVKK